MMCAETHAIGHEAIVMHQANACAGTPIGHLQGFIHGTVGPLERPRLQDLTADFEHLPSSSTYVFRS